MRHLALIVALAATPAAAADLHAVTDLPVTAALVGAVTGAPARAIAAPGTDPHDIALRPSDARALADAGLVVRIEGASPWLDDATAGAGRVLILSHPEGALHPWLDWRLAAEWLTGIAAAASAALPDDAAAFEARARDAATEITRAGTEVADRIAAAGPVLIIAGHDAWHVAEEVYGLTVAAAIANDHGHGPGAGHLREIEHAADAADCILVATGDDMRHAERLAAEHAIPVVAVPLAGPGAPPGVAGYTAILTALAEAVETCAAD